MNKDFCGDKTRSNHSQTCQLKPMSNGLCQFHGRKTPLKHGLYSKAIIREKATLQKFMRSCKKTVN